MIPSFIYGTAWKEDRTEDLVVNALKSGFHAIDTANQRKHYFEEGVGTGIAKYLKSSKKKRADLFLQSKFTYVRGQDHRLPYDPNADYPTQVQQSFQSSLQHLGTDYLDSYVLHGPLNNQNWNSADTQVWKSMEALKKSEKVHHLGVSNVNLIQLQDMYRNAEIKPTFVQNRCYARMGWDKKIREFCLANKIKYQGFSLLTANSHELMDKSMRYLAAKYKKEVTQLVFRFAQQIGMIPLTGTSDMEHMKIDLDIEDFTLLSEEIHHIENLSF